MNEYYCTFIFKLLTRLYKAYITNCLDLVSNKDLQKK